MDMYRFALGNLVRAIRGQHRTVVDEGNDIATYPVEKRGE